jgi:trimethylamine:corrinoid methyltransferase-like protein
LDYDGTFLEHCPFAFAHNERLSMNPQCSYPQYKISIDHVVIRKCIDMAPGLLSEVGFRVPNERFLSKLANKKGLRIENERVYFSVDIVNRYIDRFIQSSKAKAKEQVSQRSPGVSDAEWQVKTDGFSMMIIDLETDQLREATCDDLRNMIKLANSFGIDGSYMVMPQDVPPILQAIECFKICFETSNNIRPYDYQQPQQLPFIYEMHKVVERPMDIVLTIPSAFCIDGKDLDIFLEYYPVWKKSRDINFRVLDYPMTGITKPVGVSACATVCFCETLATHILFNLFDPEIELSISLAGGLPTDLKNACWAFGSPRAHLFRYLNSLVLPALLDIFPGEYQNVKV